MANLNEQLGNRIEIPEPNIELAHKLGELASLDYEIKRLELQGKSTDHLPKYNYQAYSDTLDELRNLMHTKRAG